MRDADAPGEAGLGAATLVIGLLCLVGAVMTLVALPGNRFVAQVPDDAEAVPAAG